MFGEVDTERYEFDSPPDDGGAPRKAPDGLDGALLSALDEEVKASRPPPPEPAINAWDSSVYRCVLCRTPGCTYRAVQGSEYCCQGCSGHRVVPGGSVPTARGVVPDQDKFHDRREPADAKPTNGNNPSREHDAGCAHLEADLLRKCWWEEFQVDTATDVKAFTLVVPPAKEVTCAPAPVVLFLSGEGHVDDRQDFLWGGVDLLMRNQDFQDKFFLVAPKPTTASGLLRYNSKWQWTWSEEAVWACFTEVLRRLGPDRVDPTRLYLTGFSLGSNGSWHVAARYGHYFAAMAPMCGGCEWPDNMWPSDGKLDEEVLRRLKRLPIRAYQIDVDPNSRSQQTDMETLSAGAKHGERDLVLPGMDRQTTCDVKAHHWCRTNGDATWELWVAEGPLMDWSAWNDYGGDKHILWQRVYPLRKWYLADYFLEHFVADDICWKFTSPPAVMDVQEKIRDCLGRAAESIEASTRRPWQEQMKEYVTKFFDSLCESCGPRPSFDKFDFYEIVNYGLQSIQFPAASKDPQFPHILKETAIIGYDRIRYSSRSFAIIRKVGGAKRNLMSIREAIDGGRDDAVKEMFPLELETAGGFVIKWITTTRDKLQVGGNLYLLPSASALKVFQELVKEGRGIPVALQEQVENVDLDSWKPLQDTINRLFDVDDGGWKKSQSWGAGASAGGPAAAWGAPTASWGAPAWGGPGKGGGDAAPAAGMKGSTMAFMQGMGWGKGGPWTY